MSMFNGFQMNNGQMGIEEAEALMDQRRRYNEIQDILAHTFADVELLDDVEDDEESERSVLNISDRFSPAFATNGTNEEHSKSPTFLSGGGDSVSSNPDHYKNYNETKAGSHENSTENEQYRQAGYNSVEQLQVLYEVRVRENERLTDDLVKTRRQASLNESEKQRLHMSLTQQTDLLANQKGKISELEGEVALLKQQIVNLESSKGSLSQELELYKAKTVDLQQQVVMMHRGPGPDPQTDALLRDIRNQHQKDIQNMQEQLEASLNKLALKTSECENLSRKVVEISRSQDAILVDKSDTINRLSHSLEESQRKIQELMKSDEIMHKYGTTDYLDDVDSDSFIHMGLSGSKNDGCTADIIAKLKDELNRCIAGHKLKRKEIYRLQEELEKERDTLRIHRDKKSQFELHLEKVQEENKNLKKELNELQDNDKVLQTVNAGLKKEVTFLESRIEKLQHQVATLEGEKERVRQEVSSEYLRFHEAEMANLREEDNKKLEAQVKYWRSQLEETLQENENVKKLYVEVCEAKESVLGDLNNARLDKEAYVKKVSEEIEKAKDEVRRTLPRNVGDASKAMELEGERQHLADEVKRLQSRADDLHKQLVDMHIKLELEEKQKEQLSLKIKEMEYTSALAREKSSFTALAKLDTDIENEKQKLQKVYDDQIDEVMRKHVQELREQEQHIKDEAVKFVTSEIDKIKGSRDDALKKWQTSEASLQEAVQKLLRMRQNAEKVITELADKLSVAQNQYDKTQKQLSDNKEKFAQFQKMCKEEFNKMRDKYQQSLNKAKDKYMSARKKVDEYKIYTQYMEKHIVNEWQRLDEGYRKAFQDIQNKLQKITDNSADVKANNNVLQVSVSKDTRTKHLESD